MSLDSRGGGGSILRLVTERRRSARSSARSSARDDIEKLRPLLTKKAQREACCQFGVLLLFMVGFIFLISLHEDIGHVFDLEYVMQIEMGREFGDHHHTIHEINDVHEIWEFIDDSFLPTMIQHRDQVGHFLPYDEWGFIAYYNRVIGGIRFVQERSKDKKCEYKKLHEFYGHCQPYHTHSHDSFGYPACNSSTHNDTSTEEDDHDNVATCYDQEQYEGVVDFYHDEAFTMDKTTKTYEMWVDMLDDEEVIYKRVQYLKDRHWLDRETKSLSIEFLAYNGQTEPLISRVSLEFEFTRVGYVKPRTIIETLPLTPYFSLAWLKISLGILYLIMIIFWIYTEFQDMHDYSKLLKKKNKTMKNIIVHHYISHEEGFGNFLDLFYIVISLSLCIVWLNFVSHIGEVEHSLQNLHRPSGEVSYDDTDADVWSQYHHKISSIEVDIDEAIEDMLGVRTLTVFVVFSMIFQMFKIWEGIPSLQGVSDTIVIAGKGLASFSIVLICLITLFAGSAMVAFGQQLEYFNDVPNAFITTMIVMTKGEPDVYYQQYKIDPLVASVWHWLLVCIMYMVCLNLILCILVDAYGEAHNAHSEGNRLTMPTLWQQTTDTFHYYAEEMWEQAQKRRMSSVLFSSRQSTFRGSVRGSSVVPSDNNSPSPSIIQRNLSKSKNNNQLPDFSHHARVPSPSLYSIDSTSVSSSIDHLSSVSSSSSSSSSFILPNTTKHVHIHQAKQPLKTFTNHQHKDSIASFDFSPMQSNRTSGSMDSVKNPTLF